LNPRWKAIKQLEDIKEAVFDSFNQVRENEKDIILLYILQIYFVLSFVTQQSGFSSMNIYPSPVSALISTAGFVYIFTKIAGDLDLENIRQTASRSLKITIYSLITSIPIFVAGSMVSSQSSPKMQISIQKMSSITPQITKTIISPSSFSQLIVALSFFLGSYMIANGKGLRYSTKESVLKFIEKPLEISSLVITSLLAVYIPLVIFALPGILVTNTLKLNNTSIPVSLFILLIGTSVGGYISIRTISNWLEYNKKKRMNRNLLYQE
jgi:hypothetical protein